MRILDLTVMSLHVEKYRVAKYSSAFNKQKSASAIFSVCGNVIGRNNKEGLKRVGGCGWKEEV